MRLTLFLLLLAGQAVGQTKPQYTVEVIINDKPFLLHVDADPKWYPSVDRVQALEAATHATVWTPKEWAEVQKENCKDASPEIAAMFECPAPAAQPAQECGLVTNESVRNNYECHPKPAPPAKLADCEYRPGHHPDADCYNTGGSILFWGATGDAHPPAELKDKLAAQVQPGDVAPLTEYERGYFAGWDESIHEPRPPAPLLPCQPNCKVEIRTKPGTYYWRLPDHGRKCPEPNMTYEDYWEGSMNIGRCYRVTRELWISGQKVGSLEERR